MPARFISRETERAACAEVEAVYRDLEARPILRQCERRTECCQFKRTGRTPQLTRGEALVLARGLRAGGRKGLPAPQMPGACPLLKADGTCLTYGHRPFGCRTHFCSAAGGPYARKEVLDLIRRLEKVAETLGADGPRALPEAVRDCLL